MQKIWEKLFLANRPSILLSFFRLWVALTVFFHVMPSLCHLADNYYVSAFKTVNTNFFTLGFLGWIRQSPDWMVNVWVGVFCISWFCFFVGFFSQVSCIVMTVSCYYFYALNSFHVGTLSWDILLVTLFLMCIVPYHGDYFSADALRRGDQDTFKIKRPYFLQRLLQMQIAFTYFYTGLYKITAQGNWLSSNPIYFLMNYPVEGVVKTFILRDYLRNQPELCYALGILIVAVELAMPFLLFWHKTRVSAIYLGFVFHVMLILTLDVPAIFFFLFPAQLLLFISPEKVIEWIENKRRYHEERSQPKIIYDGKCQFCLICIQQLKVMDLFSKYKTLDLHSVNLQEIHPQLTKEKALSQLYLVTLDGKLYGGFDVFRRICFSLPMMYPLIPIIYFPGMSVIGPVMYRFVAKNRYLFHVSKTCKNNQCFQK